MSSHEDSAGEILAEPRSLPSGALPAIADVVPIMEPQLEPRQQVNLEKLDTFYDSLKSAEQRVPHDDDAIIIRIEHGSEEHQRLQDAGVEESQLSSGVFARSTLREAGFAFINTLGSGEKGLISGIVEDPETGEAKDFTDRKLLTREELDMIYRHQQAQPDIYGLRGEDIDEVRKDMLSFLREAVAEPVFDSVFELISMIDNNPYRREDGIRINTDGKREWDAIEAYIAKESKAYMANHPGETSYRAREKVIEQFVTQKCSDIYEPPEESQGFFNDKTVREVPTHSLGWVRAGKLQNSPSPFLDSGFVFGGNLDVNVHLGNSVNMHGSDQLRINMATVHLAGGHQDYPGLSEMGGNGDQQYMPTGTFIDMLYTTDAAKRRRQQSEEDAYAKQGDKNQIVLAIQERLAEEAQTSTKRREIVAQRASHSIGKKIDRVKRPIKRINKRRQLRKTPVTGKSIFHE